MGYNRERYKSRGERRIAGFLKDAGIDFEYEYPVAVRDKGFVKIWYPDFTLPDYSAVIEYFGVAGDHAYDRQMEHKMQVYKQAGIEGIYLVESSFSGDWQEQIFERIKDSLERKTEKFNALRLSQYCASSP